MRGGGAAIAVLAFSGWLGAQQDPPPRPPEPIDETRRAAEALRRALGLQPGPAPGTAVPPGPRSLPSPPRAPHPRDLIGNLIARYLDPGRGGPPIAGPPQEPLPPPPRSETDRAADLLRRALGLEPGPAPGTTIPPGPSRWPTPPRSPHPDDWLVAWLARHLQAPAGPVAVTPVEVPAPAPAPSRAYSFRGTLSALYRARWTSSDSDQDLQALLNLGFGTAGEDELTGSLVTRLFADLDGSDADNVFNGLDETKGGAGGYLYEAFVDWHPAASPVRARIGRQSQYETPVAIDFDGAEVATEPLGDLRWSVSAYGGIPVHYFSASRSGDLLVGGMARCEPWPGSQLRLDAMHIADERITFDGEDDLLGFSWRQRLATSCQLQGQHTWLDGAGYEWYLRGDASIEAIGLDVTAAYRELLTTQRAQVTELDPYFDLLAEYHPYRQLGFTLAQDLGEHVALAAGLDVRRLVDGADAGDFNHEYERWYVTPSVYGLADDRLSFSVTAEFFDADTDEQQAFSADLRWQIDDQVRLDIGSSYYLYRFDTQSSTEREDVRVYFLRLDWPSGAGWRWNAAFSYEDDDLDSFYRVAIGARWTF